HPDSAGERNDQRTYYHSRRGGHIAEHMQQRGACVEILTCCGVQPSADEEISADGERRRRDHQAWLDWLGAVEATARRAGNTQGGRHRSGGGEGGGQGRRGGVPGGGGGGGRGAPRGRRRPPPVGAPPRPWGGGRGGRAGPGGAGPAPPQPPRGGWRASAESP